VWLGWIGQHDLLSAIQAFVAAKSVYTGATAAIAGGPILFVSCLRSIFVSSSQTHFGSSIVVIAVVAVLAIAISQLLATIYAPPPPDMSNEAVTARIAPVGKMNSGGTVVAAAPVVAAAARSAEQIYNTSCLACHMTGAAGAPILGNSAAWAPRIANGMDAMMNTVINGRGAMPARGTCGNCSDDELTLVVEYMVAKSK
jgi:cytochrome c5